MTKIFYTKYEGGPILPKTLFSRRGFINLLDDLEEYGGTDWWSIPSTPFRKFVKLFGIKIFEIKLFQVNVHSIFIPFRYIPIQNPHGNPYRRWDSINGWTEWSNKFWKNYWKDYLNQSKPKQKGKAK